ncbi:3-oxoacyl-[acyl-carrier protein] reductase [Pelomonas saccharophila]|uniref:3-oxoacyl-[acyl-carrier protein] reductase n=1 Tax=Roseateles saccharophilus TaxID=304 RepID=A0ABU1YQR3_ROSSA|nr:SDR family oxidoreductase [Roseateles saccharophilus]MDR7271203.1 3-oxoacyl-[acyl-carrier protein] reductase [Roseateles saccharophilus]
MAKAGKVALITGAGTGVGAATALMLAGKGYDLLINYSRSANDAEASAAACRAAGADVLVKQGDVAQDADCRAMAQAALERWGRIDALVNDAGVSVFGAAADWDALDADTFQRILAVNALGSFQMVRACVAALKAARGCIVNVSSVAGALGVGSSMPYIASKGAINAMTLHLARSLAPAVRVNAVCPGLITSRWFVQGVGQQGYEAGLKAYEAGVPLQRACSPEDVAEAIVWLVDGARTVTGELLMLDSGMHLAGVKPPR